MATCQHVKCGAPAPRRIAIPVSTPGAPPLVLVFCEEHADTILREHLAFPGARDKT